MALPLVIGAIAGISSIAGGIMGAIERSSASDDAKALMLKRLQELEAAGSPPETALPLVLEEFKSQGIITPELEKEISVGVSKVAQIKEDPQFKQAQAQALQFLQQRSETGLGPEEQAAFNTLRREAAKESEGKRQQIIQNMAQRGMSGSGAELAAQLSTAQAGDEALAAGGDRIAAEAARNALASMTQSGQLAGQIRGQDFDVNRTRASAEDELNRFNVSQQIARQTRNLGALNDAQMLNLKEKQRLADANVTQANEEVRRQNEAKARDWQNKLNLAQLKGGVYGDQANQRLKEGAANAQGWQQMGAGLSQGVLAAGGGLGKTAAPVAESSMDFSNKVITSDSPDFAMRTIIDDYDQEMRRRNPGNS